METNSKIKKHRSFIWNFLFTSFKNGCGILISRTNDRNENRKIGLKKKEKKRNFWLKITIFSPFQKRKRFVRKTNFSFRFDYIEGIHCGSRYRRKSVKNNECCWNISNLWDNGADITQFTIPKPLRLILDVENVKWTGRSYVRYTTTELVCYLWPK